MRSNMKVMCGLGIVFMAVAVCPSRVDAANAYPVFTDVNSDGLGFSVTDVFTFGGKYFFNDETQLNGNQILLIGQQGTGPCCHGAGMSVPVSIGENGINQSLDGPENEVVNPDPPNTTPANSVFAAIGNPSGKLENGNVIRFSAWYRSDPANPITVDPQIQPVLKLEFWKQGLGTAQDTNGGQLSPLFGDKVFDQDQHGGTTGIPDADQSQWIDFNGDGLVIDGTADEEGRVSQLSTSEWRLVETTYTVNDTFWLGIDDDIYTVEDIEEFRAVMFFGDFLSTDLSGDGNGGHMLVDNVLVEVFRETASVTPNANPNPTLSEGLAGDFNNDGTVDAADYVFWRKNGLTQDQYNTWRGNFGAMSGGGSGGAVPEPTALAMLGIFGPVLLTLLRSRRS